MIDGYDRFNDPNLDDFVLDAPVTVAYSKVFPPETFDLVVVDEAHSRSA